MATPKKSRSATHPQGQTRRRLWRPVVITALATIGAALIAGFFTIGKTFIERTDPKPSVAEPTRIEQQTHGDGSPAVGHTGGNVTIQQHVGGDKP